jgi:U3 small nucleolar RNA-associated protein 14
LDASGLSDALVQEKENELLSSLPSNDAAQRHAELVQMKELLFRNEIKLKRLKKIKSKAFRRRLKQDKRRAEEGLDQDQKEIEIKRAKVKFILCRKE